MYPYKKDARTNDKLILNDHTFSIEELITALTSQGVPIRIEGRNLHVGQHLLRGIETPVSAQSYTGCPLMTQLSSLLDRFNVIEGKISTLKATNNSHSTLKGISPHQPDHRKSASYPETTSRTVDPFKVAFESSYREKSTAHSDVSSISGNAQVCSTCGASLAPRAIFCAKCGSNVRS